MQETRSGVLLYCSGMLGKEMPGTMCCGSPGGRGTWQRAVRIKEAVVSHLSGGEGGGGVEVEGGEGVVGEEVRCGQLARPGKG